MRALMPLAAFVFAMTFSLHPATAQELGTWARATDAPAERSEVSVAEAGGKAYLIGDYNGATELLVYDLARDTWSQGTRLPDPVHHAAAAAHNGKIYVFGGYRTGWQATDAAWAYDPASGRWERRAPLPTPRAAGGAAVIGDRIHLVGGSGSGRTNTPVHEFYDPAANTWATAAPLPTPRDHLAVEAVAGCLMAVGGAWTASRRAIWASPRSTIPRPTSGPLRRPSRPRAAAWRLRCSGPGCMSSAARAGRGSSTRSRPTILPPIGGGGWPECRPPGTASGR
jgi:hypothetical protein